MVPEEWPIAAPLGGEGAYPARRAGRRRLLTVRTDFFLDPRERMSEQERALMTAMLADLLGSIADEIRMALPASWTAEEEDDGQQLLWQLSSAGLLDDLALMATLLRRADEERIVNAVKARSGAGSAYLQALIADDDEGVSAAAMALILARGRRRDRLGQPRLEFDDVPAESAEKLAYAVAAAIRPRIAVEAEERDRQICSAVAQLLARRDESRRIDAVTAALVGALAEAGRLDQRLLESAAGEGDVAFVAAALAHWAAIPLDSAWDHFLDSETSGLPLLLRLAGASRELAAHLLASLGDLLGISDLARELAFFDSLDEERIASAKASIQLPGRFRGAIEALGEARG